MAPRVGTALLLRIELCRMASGTAGQDGSVRRYGQGGSSNLTMRWLLESAMKRFPLLSVAMPCGW